MAGKARRVDFEMAVEFVEGEVGGIRDLFLPGELEAVGKVLPAMGLRFPARVEAALDLRRRPVLEMP